MKTVNNEQRSETCEKFGHKFDMRTLSHCLSLMVFTGHCRPNVFLMRPSSKNGVARLLTLTIFSKHKCAAKPDSNKQHWTLTGACYNRVE